MHIQLSAKHFPATPYTSLNRGVLNSYDYSFIESSGEKWEGFIINGVEYRNGSENESWGIVARMVIREDGMPCRTVHLLFGSKISGTAGAVDYFIRHYQQIYMRMKKNKLDSYCLIFKADKDGTIDEKSIKRLRWGMNGFE